jgi:hypothetical protein
MFMEHTGRPMGRMSAAESLEVRTVTLDQLASNGGILIPQYLKIDVEGSEMAVLSGARQLVASAHPAIFLSTHGQDRHRKCCRFLTSLGYSLMKESDELLAVF